SRTKNQHGTYSQKKRKRKKENAERPIHRKCALRLSHHRNRKLSVAAVAARFHVQLKRIELHKPDVPGKELVITRRLLQSFCDRSKLRSVPGEPKRLNVDSRHPRRLGTNFHLRHAGNYVGHADGDE